MVWVGGIQTKTETVTDDIQVCKAWKIYQRLAVTTFARTETFLGAAVLGFSSPSQLYFSVFFSPFPGELRWSSTNHLASLFYRFD